jgi:uncharacterized protein
MAIRGVTDEDLKRVLSENLTPSDSIKTPERLFGREKTLTTIDRAFSSPGRQIFIYGDRGVGKTSLALTTAYLHTGVENLPIYAMCGKTNNFAQTIQAIGNALVPWKSGWKKQLREAALISACPEGWAELDYPGAQKGAPIFPRRSR